MAWSPLHATFSTWFQEHSALVGGFLVAAVALALLVSFWGDRQAARERRAKARTRTLPEGPTTADNI